MTERRYRIIILGAGFSKPAGLPLADELWQEILVRRKTLSGRASKLNDDLDSYIEYRKRCDGVELTYDTINFEEFLGFLDIDHYLGLRGSDTWSKDGNEGQIVIKTLMGEILTRYMPAPGNIPGLYLEFARRLQPDDYVLTFNYDVLLERALDAIGKPYRLFPHRYESVSGYTGFIDSGKEEVVILKLHGSIDWFDKSSHNNIIFNSKVKMDLTKILDGPRVADDPLANMHRVANIESLYAKDLLFLATPWILSPSTNKIIYANILVDFWRGLGGAGATNLGMAIVGYSLPAHDIYARQIIYSLVKNYQGMYWNEGVLGGQKKSGSSCNRVGEFISP